MVELHFGAAPIIYTTNRLTAVYELPDLARWQRNLLFRPKGDWLIWQYRDRGVVHGIDGPVDLNVAKTVLFHCMQIQCNRQ